jgi:SAM-dependent methyltransferase
MRKLGWDCTGLEPDPNAGCHQACDPSIRVLRTTLSDADLPPRSFDVITMSHVIEHVPYPVAVLAECGRLLAPSGELVVLTPNLDSRGRSRFGRDWRNWECPRHLQIFSKRSLVACARAAGLSPVACTVPSKAAWWIWNASERIRNRRLGRHSGRPHSILSGLERLIESLVQASTPWLESGDELLMRARPGGVADPSA